MSTDHKQALTQLVAGLTATSWSTWQSTAGFSYELEQAEKLLAADRVRDAAPALLEAAKSALQVFINQGWEDDLLAAKELKAAIAASEGEKP